MTVYNRKMFRKKGGGATGIMASGPELIKAQSGVSVNIPGGGSTLQRSGFPGLRAFGGLGQTIPSQFRVPTLEEILAAGGPTTNTRARGNISGRSLNPKTTVDRPRAVQVPDYNTGIVDIVRSEKFGGTQFGRDAVKQLSKTESDIYNRMGPFRGRDLTASEKLDEDVGESSSESAIKQGFRSLGEGSAINDKLKELSSAYGAKGLTEDYDVTDPPVTTDTDPKKKKTNEKKTIYEQTTDTDTNDKIETVVMNQKGEGTEVKGTGAAVKGKGKADGNSETTKGKWSLYVDKLQKDVAAGKNVDGADSTLLAHGFDKDTVEEMSTEDKVKEVRGIIENIYGRETPDNKNMGLEDDLRAMDTIMLGLSIAAGESPDALTNVIRGSKDYVGKRAARLREELKQKKQDQKDLDMLTLKTVLQREDKKADRDFQEKIIKVNQKHDMRKIATQNSNDLEKLGIQLDFKTYLNESNQTFKWNMKKVDVDIANVKMKNEFKMLTKKLASSELIARNQQLGADARKAAEIEAAETRAIIGNFDKGYGLAFIEGKNKELTGDKLIDYAMENGKKFAKNSLLTGPDSLRRLVINNAGTIMKEQNVDFGEATQIIYNAILNDDKLNRVFAKDIEALGLDLNIGEKTDISGFKVIKEN